MSLASTASARPRKIVVGMGELKVATGPEPVIVTYALGSCLGITIYDPVSQVGGLLHVMLPDSAVDPARAKARPGMFIDTAVPRFFRTAYHRGAVKQRLIVKVAGGAQMSKAEHDHFNIGARNFSTFRKLLWQNSVLLRGQDVGGNEPRTMSLRLSDGQITIRTRGNPRTL